LRRCCSKKSGGGKSETRRFMICGFAALAQSKTFSEIFSKRVKPG